MVRKVDGLRGPGVVRRSRRYYGVYQFTDAGPLESADFQHLATEVACKFSVSILSPRFRTMSIMFSAIMTGTPSSQSWVVR